jgi:hypothetical protein
MRLERALIEREQIVVPVSVSVGTDIRRLAGDADDADIGTFAIVWVGDKKGVATRVDARDDFLARPFPSGGRIAQMSDVLMGALRVRFGYAGYFNVCHKIPSTSTLP